MNFILIFYLNYLFCFGKFSLIMFITVTPKGKWCFNFNSFNSCFCRETLLSTFGASNIIWSSDAAVVIRDINSMADPTGWDSRFPLLLIKERSRTSNWKFCWNRCSSNRAADFIAKQFFFLFWWEHGCSSPYGLSGCFGVWSGRNLIAVVCILLWWKLFVLQCNDSYLSK